MPEFTLTFTGPAVCSKCGGPVGEVGYMDEHGGKFCSIVCAEAGAVEHEDLKQQTNEEEA